MQDASPDAPASLDEALLAFQTDPPQVIKDAEGEVRYDGKGGKPGGSYKYKYLSLQALLAALRPRLGELGLLWKSRAGWEDGRPVVLYSMTHVQSGERDEGVMPLVPSQTMQGLGGAISFGRRYALITYLNLAPDVDEDGALPRAEVAAQTISKGIASQLVDKAKQAGRFERLQLAASTAHGSDVGDCSTEPKAVKAMMKLTAEQADKLFDRLDQIVKGEQP